MKTITLNSASELGRLEKVINKSDGAIEKNTAEKENAVMESYIHLMTDLVCESIYPTNRGKTMATWGKGIGYTQDDEGAMYRALHSAGVESSASKKRLSEGTAKVMLKLLKDFKSITTSVDPADSNAVFQQVSKILDGDNHLGISIKSQKDITKHTAKPKKEEPLVDKLVRQVAELTDAEIIEFERKPAEALKSKAEAKDAQLKAEAESVDVNDTIEALLDA